MFDNNIITLPVQNSFEFYYFVETVNTQLNQRYLELRRQVQNENAQTVFMMEIE